MKGKSIYHLLALFVTIVWGVTFVSTKVLLLHGLSPANIFIFRFIIAYVAIWFFSPKKLFAETKKDEFLFVVMGITGGSMYFMAENTALSYTLASNVSLIISTAPLITAFMSHLWVKGESVNKTLIYGSLLALAGVACVVYNGSFILKMNPIGDLLTLASATLWGFYTIILKRLDTIYPILFITRKIFFYGLMTLAPTFIIWPTTIDLAGLLKPTVLANLLFLSLVASMLCYIFWNVAVKNLGAIRTTNYIYLTPIITFAASVIVLNESITPVAIAGAICILCGLWLAGREKTR
ncbi:MAG: DMT family transporter [Tannerellaceae bacterium]|jgi:drug/metabolite transporter (DMT)-like permease|nr:DMT family transporter [Tannerellaceae bacterium]